MINSNIDLIKKENSNLKQQIFIMKNELDALRQDNITLQELLNISESKLYNSNLKLDEYEDIIDSYENKNDTLIESIFNK